MRKLLITGAAGFVARHFLNFLNTRRQTFDVMGLDLAIPAWSMAFSKTLQFRFHKIDLLKKKSVEKAIATFKPDHVLHLASLSSVGLSWKQPAECFTNITNIFLNLAESLRIHCPKARILSVGSAEVYGCNKNKQKVNESDFVSPMSPYGIARSSQEMLAFMYRRNWNMQIILTRSFNHIGVGQKSNFVIPSFVEQFVTAQKKRARFLNLRTGNLKIVRDFTNVKDVVRAYDLLLTQGRPGEIYNVCSGKGITLHKVISMLENLIGIKAHITVDRKLLRAHDFKIMLGDYSKIHSELGWSPQISLKETLLEMIAAYQKSQN